MQETSADPIGAEAWPVLPYKKWGGTINTLHLLVQIVGKVRLALAPPVNHWWHVALYVTPRGLTTTAIPHGARTFAVEFDFVEHLVRVVASDGAARTIPLVARPVSHFYRAFVEALEALDLAVPIWTTPVERPAPVPFERDRAPAAYRPAHAHLLWKALVQADRVLQGFRGGFAGKCSPVHFFWGGFDLAVTRFSGREAPEHGPVPHTADAIVREAYSHEVSSAGFWPGNADAPEPVFYAYAYPEPDGYREAPVAPPEAFYSPAMGEHFLRYETVRTAADPDATLLAFLESTYAAAADLGRWDRAALERPA